MWTTWRRVSLLARWHLPESVISVIGFFDNSNYNGSYRFHLESIRAASKWIIADMSGTPAPLSGSDGLLGVLGLSQRMLDHRGYVHPSA